MNKPSRKPIPDLDAAIEAHAKAFLAGDENAAEQFVAPRGLETHRASAAHALSKRPFASFETLARAKIGFQYISKMRWNGAHGRVVHQNRWSQEDSGKWKIVEVEDLSEKRSAWSDIPPLQPAASRS
jgi:hypothetical protein